MTHWSHQTVTTDGPMTAHPLTPDRLVDMDEVFGQRGVARRCYCMHWRRPDGGYDDERDNRDRFQDIALEGPPPGLLGYVGDDPVGWVQVGPRAQFPTLGRSRLFKPVDDVEPWTINCFVVRTGQRRKGIGRGLLESAIEFAKHNQAEVIEAYPVDGTRESVVDYFTGTYGLFADYGFTELLRRNDTRPIVRLTL
ncbi:MAG TPA: GNAT family N-acetyltransferase [Acidimicrobiia bacterium]|nr:GNAT family N-acetyltransferase [Acidimicrobiia bacterium]